MRNLFLVIIITIMTWAKGGAQNIHPSWRSLENFSQMISSYQQYPAMGYADSEVCSHCTLISFQVSSVSGSSMEVLQQDGNPVAVLLKVGNKEYTYFFSQPSPGSQAVTEHVRAFLPLPKRGIKRHRF